MIINHAHNFSSFFHSFTRPLFTKLQNILNKKQVIQSCVNFDPKILFIIFILSLSGSMKVFLTLKIQKFDSLLIMIDKIQISNIELNIELKTVA